MDSKSASQPEVLEVSVERILPGGLGLAHADGRTLMVALSAPGDRLRVRIDRVKGNVAFASIVEVLEPSPQRVEPPCPYFGRCGGCDFQQLTYEAQLAAKVEIIRDCLRRIGGIDNVADFNITPAPHEWHYRARAQWQYDSIRKRLGYFEANSRRVCDVAECAVLVPELQAQLEWLRPQINDGELPDDARYFRAIAGDEELSVVDDRGRSPSVREGEGSEPPATGVPGAASALGWSFAGAPSVITVSVHSERYRLTAQSFFQTNIDLMPQLIDAALANAHGARAIELYCGVGLFTVPLARRFQSVIAVEDDADASKFAQKNLANAELTNATVVNRDVADWLEEDLECGGRVQRRRRFGSLAENSIQRAVEAGALQKVDFLLLDPPRTGAESRVISGIINLKPKEICYVSCDPATLARDLKKLIAGGYSIASIQAFDMFPQTHHVETVVHLRN